jgi:hypothetical protein
LPLISLSEFARRNGVTRVAISKAIKNGRLPSTDGKIDPELVQPLWDCVKGPRARRNSRLGEPMASQGTKLRQLSTQGQKLPGQVCSETSHPRAETSAQVTLATQGRKLLGGAIETVGLPSSEATEVTDSRPPAQVSGVTSHVRLEPSAVVNSSPVPALRQSPITISINGAEYIELAKWCRDEGVTMPACVRTRCGLPAWNLRGREMAGRSSAIRQNVMVLDRLSVTIMVTDEERAHLDVGASAAGLSFPQYIRTRCGWQVRQTSLPNTPERDSEEDDAWERLRQLGLEPEKYFED